MAGKLLTKKEAAERLHISVRMLSDLLADQEIVSYRIGSRTIRVSEDSIEAYLEQQTVQPRRRAPERFVYHPGDRLV